MSNIELKDNNFYEIFNNAGNFISRLSGYLLSNKKVIPQNLLDIQEKFYIKYMNQISLKRFAIGIFGKIDSGKSTIWNYCLGLRDILQTKNEIATKFICFIRHNKNNKIPKFYEIEPKKRNNSKDDYFNFEKGQEIQGNFHEIVSQRNKEIIEMEKNEEIIQDISKYFIIIEANLIIFNDPALEKYADIFEFLDIPGLDEGSFDKNLYLSKLIPVIMPNLSFSFFIFNGMTMEDTSTQIIIKHFTTYFTKRNEFSNIKIANEIDKNITLNSLYIINKVDDEKDYDENKNKAKKILKELFKSENYDYDVNKLNIIPLSALNLLFEKYKFEDFYYFLGNTYVQFSKLDEKKRKDFKSYLSDELKKYSKKDKNDEDDSSDSDKSDDEEEKIKVEFNKLTQNEKDHINELISKIAKINNNFDIKTYYKYKNKFHPKITNENKINSSNELYKAIQLTMSRIVDNFTQIEEFKDLYQFFENKNSINKMYLLAKQINENYKCINDPIKLIHNLESIYRDELIKIDINNGKQIINFTENSKKLFELQKNLYYLLLGISNSGKSTYINSVIIGEDILPTSNNECTKIGIILQHCDEKEELSLYKVELKSYKFDENDVIYFDYDDKNDIIAKGKENIKEKIIELNKLTKKDEINLYLLKTPLKIFDYIDNEEIRRHKQFIHIIDFPGLDTTTMKEAKLIKSKLFQSIHGFIFLNRREISTINNDANNKLINELLRDIRQRNLLEFSFKSCLFVMISENNEKIDDFRKSLNISINDSQKEVSFIDILKNPNLVVKSEDIKVIQFSNFYFRDYIKEFEFITNDNKFLDELRKQENEDDLKKFYENNLKSKIKLPREYKLSNDKVNVEEKIFNNISYKISGKKREKLSPKIAKYYSYILNNPNELICYQKSGFDKMKNYLTQIFLHSIQFYNEHLKESAAKHILELIKNFTEIEKTINIDESEIDRDYFEKNKDKELDSLNNLKQRVEKDLEKRFKELVSNIQNCFDSLYDNLDSYRNDFKKLEEEKIVLANKIYSSIIPKINNIIKNMVLKFNLQIKYIESHKKKKERQNKELQQNYFQEDNPDLTAIVEDNFLVKSINNPVVMVLNCIPVLNFVSWGVSLIGGFFDHFANHSEEFKKEIERIKNIFESKITNDRYNIDKIINKSYLQYNRTITRIFNAVGKDLDKIKENREPLIKIINEIENFLFKIIFPNS